MFEEFWDEGIGKLGFIQDNEGVAFLRPSNQILVFSFLEKTATVSCLLVICHESNIIYLLSFCTNGGMCFRLF